MMVAWRKAAGSFFLPFAKSGRRGYGSGAKAAKLLLVTVSLLTFPSPGLTNDDADPDQQYIRYDNENVSVALNNVRAVDAALLMRSTTGVAITLPSSTISKTINLRFESAKVDYAVRTLLTVLQLNNSFSVYDGDGHLTEVIALDKAASHTPAEIQPAEEDKKNTVPKELTAQERESLLRDFGRWSEISAEEQKSIHSRLRNLPVSKERDQVIHEYVRLVLGVREPAKSE
jgi:hypothetical protein